MAAQKSETTSQSKTINTSYTKSNNINVTESETTSQIKTINTSYTKSNNINVTESLPSKYQYYQAIPDVLRLKLRVKGSENIPSSTKQYSVKISLPTELFEGNDVKETSRIMAIRQPQWNETLSFLVKKNDFFDKKKFMLDLELCSTGNGDECSHPEDKTVSMGELCEEDSVQFNSDIKVQITGKFDAERDVKFRNINKLCKQEQEFRTKRQAVVFRNMKKKLKMKNLLQVEAAPNIAIIGSGGGMRAVVGMCGAMTALQDEGFLDSAMYTAGLSGSAWYLLTMYAHDKQLNPKAVTDTIRKKLEPFRTIQFGKAWYSWKYLTKSKVFNSGKYFTITDTFGEMIGDLLLEEKCKQKWSNQRKKLEDGSAPLPLIAALHVRNEETIETYNEWIELSPYEVFMPRYGAAIDMKNFGDRFYGGFITKEYGEQPIHFLQGMCGSGYAKVRDLKSTESFLSVIKRTTNKLFNNFDATFVGKVPNYLHGIPEFTPLVENLVETTDRIVEPEKKDMMLVDAGIAFNSPYPAVLHPARKVDVILSFDFSERGEDKKWPFEELEKAKKWADERNVPFPALRLNDIRTKCEKKGDYDEVYIFEGNKEAPTIVHFVMINKSFRKRGKKGGSRVNGQQDFDIFPTYSTIKFGYSNEEFDKLKSLVEYNVYNNKEKIVECIQKVIKRKQFNI